MFLKSLDDSRADIFKLKEDPINLLLLAAIADTLPLGMSSLPIWEKIADSKNNLKTLAKFASDRVSQIKNHIDKKWIVKYVGPLPELKWSSNIRLDKGSYFSIYAKDSIPKICNQGKSLLMPTEIWITKISSRYNISDHPFDNIKSWAHLPESAVYGTITVLSGALMLAVCPFTIVTRLDGRPCVFGGQIIGSTGDVMEYTVKPDLRHWVNVPSAISIEEIGTTISDNEMELSCLDQNKFPISNNIFTLF